MIKNIFDSEINLMLFYVAKWGRTRSLVKKFSMTSEAVINDRDYSQICPSCVIKKIYAEHIKTYHLIHLYLIFMFL